MDPWKDRIGGEGPLLRGQIDSYSTPNRFGRWVAQARRERGMRQWRLLAKLQVSGPEFTAPVLSKLERQRRRVSDLELKFLYDILGVSVDWLVGREPKFPPSEKDS